MPVYTFDDSIDFDAGAWFDGSGGPSELILPHVYVEVGFGGAGNNTYLLFDDLTRGLFDTATFAPEVFYTSVSADVIGVDMTRGRSKPLEEFNPGNLTVVLDNTSGDYDPNNLSGPYVTTGVSQVLPMAPIRVRESIAGTIFPRFSGYVDAWVQSPRGVETATTTITATDGLKVLASFDPGGPSGSVGAGEDTGARINRVLTMAGIPLGDRDIDTGVSLLQATTLDGVALQQIQDATKSEQGYFFHATDGKYTFRNRTTRYGVFRAHDESSDDPGVTPPAVWFTNVGADDEPSRNYEAAQLAYDDELVKNTVNATNTGGILQQVADSASVGTYLTKTDSVTGLWLRTDGEAHDWASQILVASKDAEQRVETLEFLPAVYWPADMWATVLALDFGDIVEVNYEPVAGDTVRFLGFFDGITESISDGINHRIALKLTPTTAFGTSIVFYAFAPDLVAVALDSTIGFDTFQFTF